ncbi:hypothetical protein LTR91_018048 [Friedmanniomyces endolithicus]|uniref:Uncharacterized protein n=1 Tax=Friedmanniomyces endolithicus TaxID=329885 RepID=A0AAN6HEC4_9PEZI|nr:hypothetical protein LTR94_021902 [Friedmanniomyces endolithicus]KAK0771298.1 hypothetical protein LTR38_017278 [Friedmanniomyces endolithicus]KAK0826285.1 hypothetical protein LTR03_017216 [Friedmanniomyces endolithicus]KAK0841293.1 hypothetical protein LTS02_016885 [Friedmanniomyces endolithicus]KAK0861022.1 hypothetical protein LTR87_017119 [Friedmanniomyces endolithicus]
MLYRRVRTIALAEQHSIDPARTGFELEPVSDGRVLVRNGQPNFGSNVDTSRELKDADVPHAPQSNHGPVLLEDGQTTLHTVIREEAVFDALGDERKRCASDREHCAQDCAQLLATLQHMISTLGDQTTESPTTFGMLLSEFRTNVLLATQSSLAIMQTASQPQEENPDARTYGPRTPGQHFTAAEFLAPEPYAMMPTVMIMYIIRAGDASIAGERLADFDYEVAQRHSRNGEPIGSSTDSPRLTAAEEQTRLDLKEDLQSAVEDAALWKARCIKNGLDPDATRFRRRSSTRARPQFPIRALAERLHNGIDVGHVSL